MATIMRRGAAFALALLLASVAVFTVVIGSPVYSQTSQRPSGGDQENVPAIPKTWGRIIDHTFLASRDQLLVTLLLEAQDGTLRIVRFNLWDARDRVVSVIPRS